MPPRKSNVSVGSNGAEEGGEGTSSKAAKDGLSVEDLSLPKSMIARLSKGVLPANTQIHKDALLALHKSTSVFVSYIASNSNEIAQSSGKKTISPQDVMEALKDCEFEDFLDRLHQELRRYSDIQCNKRNTYRRKIKVEKQVNSQLEGDQAPQESEAAEEAVNGAINGHADGDDEDRPMKKMKAEDGSALAPDADGMEDEDMDDDQDGTMGDGDDPTVDYDVDEGDDEGEDQDEEEDEEPSENVLVDADPDDEVAVGGMRDEALDDPGSESD